MKLKFSMAYHSQTDGQTEVVSSCHHNLLRCLVGEHARNWDSILPSAKFTYHSINRSIGIRSFEVVLGKPLDLVPCHFLHRFMSWFILSPSSFLREQLGNYKLTMSNHSRC